MLDSLDFIFETIFRFIVETIVDIITFVFFFYTGEIIFFILYAGRRKPRWDFYFRENRPKGSRLQEISWLAGFGFWLGLAIILEFNLSWVK